MPHNAPVPSRKWVALLVVIFCAIALILATTKG
jgi:hypothetical protein